MLEFHCEKQVYRRHIDAQTKYFPEFCTGKCMEYKTTKDMMCVPRDQLQRRLVLSWNCRTRFLNDWFI